MLQSTGEMFYNPYKEFKRSRAKPSEGASTSSLSRSGPSNDGTASSSSQSATQRPDPFETAGNMAGAGLQGFGKFTATYFRGVIVDIPHAAAEGFRRAPQLYGEKPKDYGTVKDWKSGIRVGGKNFVGGMSSGVADIIKHPIKGAIEGGREGALRGLARGGMGMATKMPSGEFSYHII